VEESGARYPLTIDPIAQQAYLKASNTETGDWFGYSVAICDEQCAVLFPGWDDYGDVDGHGREWQHGNGDANRHCGR
jgi:hypothetical protein